MKTLVQSNIFGGFDHVSSIRRPKPAKPINGHAMALCILLENSDNWIDILHVIMHYKYPKFQTRLGEIIKVYPNIIEKRKKIVMTRFGINTDVKEYRLLDYDKALFIYNNALNVKGGSGKVLNGVNVIALNEG